MAGPAGFFITFTTYGTRVHGDPRGSFERSRSGDVARSVLPNARRERHEQLLGDTSFVLNAAARKVIADTISEVCAHKGWKLHVVNVRTNHVHAVVSGDERPETMMNTFKAWATRRLRERRIVGDSTRVWTRHGSTVHLRDEQDVVDAGTYVLEGQGIDLGGTRLGGVAEED